MLEGGSGHMHDTAPGQTYKHNAWADLHAQQVITYPACSNGLG